MRTIRYFAAAACCYLALGGCNTIGNLLHPSTQTQVAITQGDDAVDEAFNVAGQAYLAAAPSLSPTAKAAAKAAFAKAYVAVQAADAAAKAGSATDLQTKAAAAMSAIADAKAALSSP